MLKNMPATYDPLTDMWIIDVETVLSPKMLKFARDKIYSVNAGRRALMKSVDAKQNLEKALSALTRGRIQQRLSGKGDQNLFQSTERTNPSRVFNIGGK